MNNKQYSTKEIASDIGVHVNTIRFYEEIGFITKPKRKSNGYRIYTQLHLDQCRLIRTAMRAEILQNGLRDKAVEIVRKCAVPDFGVAYSACEEYCMIIDKELQNARSAIAAVEDLLRRKPNSETSGLRRHEAAEKLGVTDETLRTWERNGLLTVKRLKNGYRVYNEADMKRLNIIRTLRCANYSLAAILRLLNGLNQNEPCSVETVLNTPRDDEDIISACDRLIVSLNNTRSDAELMLTMISELAEKNPTIH